MRDGSNDEARQQKHRPRAYPRHAGRSLAGWGATTAFALVFAVAAFASQNPAASSVKAPPKPTTPGTIAGLSQADAQTFADRFDKEVWPVMQDACAPCHSSKNASQLLLLKDSRATFLKLLGEGFFDVDNHSSLAERVATTDKQIVMPPVKMDTLSRAQITVFTKFAEDLKAHRADGAKADEAFPPHLETAYTGKKLTEGLDNTFITYRQLRGKVKAIFGDDWNRDDRDLFVENVQLFGGADFVKRFDETAKATPTFFTGVDLLGRDVASRAYLAKSGPFAGLPDNLPSPVGMKAPTPAYTQAINRMYNRMLFRDATTAEQKQAFTFLQDVYKSQGQLAQTAPQDVRFSLRVRDDAGMHVSDDVSIRVSADKHPLYSEYVDQSKAEETPTDKTASQTLTQPFTFAPGDAEQKIFITNAGTHGNVSIQGVALRGPLPLKTETVLHVADPQAAQPEGAWKINTQGGITSYEDGNDNKGASHVGFPVKVAKAGQYEVALLWRRFSKPVPKVVKPKKGKPSKSLGNAPTNGAENVLVEVTSASGQSRLVIPPTPPVPPKGEAHFFIDETLDTIPFADLKTAFQFGTDKTSGVEIRNDDTHKKVVADAVQLMPATTGPMIGAVPDESLVLKGEAALGAEKWGQAPARNFKAFNTVGPKLLSDVNDEGDKTGELGLLYNPLTGAGADYDARKFYKVGVIFPGAADNESRVPVVVHAQASSPIVQVVAPYHAHVGSPITIDASSTYNLQHSPLRFQWTQIGGPRVAIADPTAKVLKFAAPQMTARQAAWEGLCRALMAHPDFLFTRPRSLAQISDAKERRRLQLVKIAQDLVARTPTEAELARVDKGEPLSNLIDTYLASPEWKDFYFHRVRLYVESHGTVDQDEPARLWTYIAQNNRSFKEILTADYTVSPTWQKTERPAYYGKTGVLTMKGFIEGKPGLPHFNYPAQVCEKFLGYVFEVPDEVLQMRDGITAAATTDPNSMCYTCHKVLTPLAYQRSFWDDNGAYVTHNELNMAVDDTDQGLVASYPFKGAGLEAFATQAQNKERFVRTILQTHFVWYFGRELRYDTDERALYRRLWNTAETNHYALKPVIKAIMLSPEYLSGPMKPAPTTPAPVDKKRKARIAQLAAFHQKVLK